MMTNLGEAFRFRHFALSLQQGQTLTGDWNAWQAVMSVDEERARLEREAEALVTMDDPEVEQRLIDVYERCGRALGLHYVAH